MKNTKQFKLFLIAAFVAVSSGAFAQVKIGDNPTVIKSSAVLEVESTSKAVYPPRVALTSANVAAPVTGLTTADAGATVYNTANAGTGANAVVQGLCSWDGVKWVCDNGQQTTAAAFSARKSAAQVITSGTFKMTFDSEYYDRGNDYNSATSTFVAASAGVYQVNGCISLTAGAGPGGRYVDIYKNGAQYLQIVAANLPAGQGMGGCGSGNLLLATNDVIELYVSSGGSGATVNPSGTVFEIFKISN